MASTWWKQAGGSSLLASHFIQKQYIMFLEEEKDKEQKLSPLGTRHVFEPGSQNALGKKKGGTKITCWPVNNLTVATEIIKLFVCFDQYGAENTLQQNSLKNHAHAHICVFLGRLHRLPTPSWKPFLLTIKKLQILSSSVFNPVQNLLTRFHESPISIGHLLDTISIENQS